MLNVQCTDICVRVHMWTSCVHVVCVCVCMYVCVCVCELQEEKKGYWLANG